MKKVLLLIFLFTVLCGCTNSQQIENEQKAFDLQMKKQCSDSQSKWDSYFKSSNIIEENDTCETSIFYSKSQNSCIGAYNCYVGQGSKSFGKYGVVDYLTKNIIFQCGDLTYVPVGYMNYNEFINGNGGFKEDELKAALGDSDGLVKGAYLENKNFYLYELDLELDWEIDQTDEGIEFFFEDEVPANKAPNICEILQKKVLLEIK